MEDREVAGVRCSTVLALLSDYLDGELGAQERRTIEAHVAGCDVCERFGARFATAIQTLRRLPPPRSEEATLRRLEERLSRESTG
jgi:anti-sigma factor RsiW